MIAQMAEALRRRETSCRALVRAALERIEEAQPRLNAFITILRETAQQRAIELDGELARGSNRGPLHGVPVAVKDLINLCGIRTTGGARVFGDAVASTNAACVERLERAGAVIVGKTGMHELAYGITSNNPHFGAVRNPHDPGRIPGGSSGGSGAAVGGGMVPVALGTDTGGSIRIPASFCGCVGLKPTYGLVDKRGVLPLGFSLDHVGPLAASVDDAAITLNAIAAGPRQDFRPGDVGDLRGVRVGRPQGFFSERLTVGVAARIEAAFTLAMELGADVVDVELPDIEEMNAVARVVLLAEASAALEPYMGKRELFGADVLALLDQGRLLPATMYVNAQRLRRRMVRAFQKTWERVDFLFTPTTPTTAPGIGAARIDIGGIEEDVRMATTRLVRSINLLGIPAISVPCGPDDAGLPVGLQIIGQTFDDAGVLRVGAALERAEIAGGA